MGIALTGSFVTGIFALLIFVGAYDLRHHFFSRFRFADLLYTPTLIDDVLLGEGHLKDWFFWPTPQIFTEIPLYLPIHLLSLPQEWATLLYSTCQGIYTLFICYWLVRVIANGATLALKMLTLLCGLSAVFLTNVDVSIYLPFYHYSSFVFGLFFFGALIELRASVDWRRTTFILGLMAIVGSLLGSSDFIFVAWVLLPIAFIALCCLLFVQGLRLKSFATIVVVVLAIVGARWLWSTLEFKVDPVRYSRTGGELFERLLEEPIAFCQAMAVYVWTFIKMQYTNFFRGVAFTLFVLLALPLSYAPLCRRLDWLDAESQLRLRDFSVIALVVVALNVFGFSHHDQQPERYMVAANYMPVIYVVVVLTLGGAFWSWGRLSTVAGVVLLGFSVVRIDWMDINLKARPSNGTDGGVLASCLDAYLPQYNAKRGVSDWFQARATTELSRSGLTVVPVHGSSLKPFWWASSRREFPHVYDFALLHEPSRTDSSWGTRDWYYVNRERMIRVNGAPLASTHCGDTEVLVYPPGELRVGRKMTNQPRIPVGVFTQVYWRTPDQGFDESRSVKTFIEAELGRDGYYAVASRPVRLALPKGLGGAVVFRIDAVDVPGFVRVRKPLLVDQASGNGDKSRVVLHRPILDKHFSFNHLRPAVDHSGWWVTASFDSWFLANHAYELPTDESANFELEYLLDWREVPDSTVLTVKR
ncbi:MAG: hypothetical protein CL390_08800 [Acidiferrobacteraceae bacterium]|nr:hypothetical protein [Acidiferrobacteraceae bacterium]